MTSTRSQSQSKGASDALRASLQAGLLQRKCACGQHTIAGSECAQCEQKHFSLQRATRNPELGARNSGGVPPIVHDVLRSPGQPLDAQTRAFMEPRFACDFSQVHSHQGYSAGVAVQRKPLNGSFHGEEAERVDFSGESGIPSPIRTLMERRFGTSFSDVQVHADADAGSTALEMGAKAFTKGPEIYFAPGYFQPYSQSGLGLLAHELAHVVQQRNGRFPVTPTSNRGAQIRNELEDEADEAAVAILNHQPASVSAQHTNSLVQRQVPTATTYGVTPTSGEDHQPGNEPVGPARNVPYRVVAGDTLGSIAQRFGTTVVALRTINHLRSDTVRVGQLLQVPQVSGCALPVPNDADTQILAAAIFGEADAARALNDEREAIAWAFLNSVQHTVSLCDGSICPQLNSTSRRAQCNRDRRDLGDTVLDAVRIGSRAFNGNRWRMVMSGNAMFPEGNLCLLSPSSEITALRSAINTASAVTSATTLANNYVRFNRAANQPPSDRMESAAAIAGHTFYRFIPNRECG